MAKKLANVTVVVEKRSDPVRYYFAETSDISNLHDSIKREDLPSGVLKPNTTFTYTDSAYPTDPLNSICFLVRASTGKLLASSCDASGVVLNISATSEKPIAAPRKGGGYVLGSGEKTRVRTIADLPEQPIEYKVRHVVDQDDRPKGTWGSLVLFIIFFIVLYFLSDWLLTRRKRKSTTS